MNSIYFSTIHTLTTSDAVRICKKKCKKATAEKVAGNVLFSLLRSLGECTAAISTQLTITED